MYQINFALCLCYNPHHHHHHLHQHYHCAVIIVIVFFWHISVHLSAHLSTCLCHLEYPLVDLFVYHLIQNWCKKTRKREESQFYFIFLQGNQWASPSEEESIMDMQLPLSSSTATPNNQSSEDDHKAPKLYFDVDEAKEKKYATYEDLRKKHRERWNPPSLSSSSQTRKEQVGKVDSLLKRFS